ncbi:hypothetical protein EDEG_00963 [Edhazardia aedis USNM 41457]|uniref:Uncharacterized protein n=1 Tax=Edhazardia aedis (strain USNM 41457) TaxID=1003232 RepID=J9DBH8_EDHAE|nr:hypothetical protein EDEG_00963 [Edhazardia aedis USNM 41457]|eukprot:EJW04849.1 hypothetical protein EDEG_00963 [Edhazardia aedis USNM 41457]
MTNTDKINDHNDRKNERQTKLWFGTLVTTILLPLSHFGIAYYFLKTYMFALLYIPLLVMIVPFLMALLIPLFHLNKSKKIVAFVSIIIISIIGCAINQFFSTTQSCYAINASVGFLTTLSPDPIRKVFVVLKNNTHRSHVDGDDKFKSSVIENYFNENGKNSKENKRNYIHLSLNDYHGSQNDIEKIAKAYTRFNWTRYLPNGGFVIANVNRCDLKSVKKFFKTKDQLVIDFTKNTRK